MLIGHSLADRHGILLAVDSRVCEIMQREEGELVGVAFQTLTHPDDCVRNTIMVAQLKTGQGPTTIRKRYVRPNGSFVWADVQISRLHGREAGNIVGTIQLIDADTSQHSPESLWRAAKLENSHLQRRRLQLGESLFSDYEWLVLLQIYLAEAEGRAATVRSISETAALRTSLISRCLANLEQNRMVERMLCPDQPIQLTGQAWKKIENLLDRDFAG